MLSFRSEVDLEVHSYPSRLHTEGMASQTLLWEREFLISSVSHGRSGCQLLVPGQAEPCVWLLLNLKQRTDPRFKQTNKSNQMKTNPPTSPVRIPNLCAITSGCERMEKYTGILGDVFVSKGDVVTLVS